MEKRHKDILRVLVGRLRAILVGKETEQGFLAGSLDRELERIGISPDGKIASLDTLRDTRNGELYAYRVAADQLAPLAEELRPAARQEIIERAAYTWINRLLALRAMEVRNLIEDTLRAQEDYDGLSEQLYLLRLDHPELASGEDRGWWAVLNAACEKLASALPGLFTLADPTAALHPSSDALVQCIDLVGGRKPILPDVSLAELNATFADPDAIGWSYQFYQEEAKAAIDLKCKNGGKVASRSELAAKTQLFTEPYMVQWLLQNSLGRSYHEAYPASRLPEQWPYYIKPELRPDNAPPERIFLLDELTLLDPCMGSGHFLREAFDMFVAMYREQQPKWSIKEIVSLVLGQHIFGIDIDPRAAQLSALTLYLRAWELVRETQDLPYKISHSVYIPPRMNLATTPTNLNKGMLQRHLENNPHDHVLESLLKGIFEGLEQADILGSLLRSREEIDQAIDDLRNPHTIRMDFDPADADFRRTIIEMAKIDPQYLRRKLFDRIADSFHAEASFNDDVSMSLFGYEAERGVRLLQLLDSKYAVVVTNPPYLGSKYMHVSLKMYAETFYSAGKRDLYSSFMIRCLGLCEPNGRVSMITMHNWMFLRSFYEIRALDEEKIKDKIDMGFTGILRDANIETLAHLGTNAFEEIGGEVVQSVMFILLNRKIIDSHEIMAYRLVGLNTHKEKVEFLRSNNVSQQVQQIYNLYQIDILSILETPIIYWLQERFYTLIKSNYRLSSISDVKVGLQTGDNDRFLRYFWETLNKSSNLRWFKYAKGGGYGKWVGLELLCVDWENNGNRIKSFPTSVVRSPDYHFKEGLTYSLMASGNLAMRLLDDSLFDVMGMGVFPSGFLSRYGLSALLSTHTVSYLLRVIVQDLKFNAGYTSNLPLPIKIPSMLLEVMGEICVYLKSFLVEKNLIEMKFKQISRNKYNYVCALIHTVEGWIEQVVCEAYELSGENIQTVIDETAMPAGWHPLINGYDELLELPNYYDLPTLPTILLDYFTIHKRIALSNRDLANIKEKLRNLYENCSGLVSLSLPLSEENSNLIDYGSAENSSTTYNSVPTETFLEELSVKMKLHPISVYWLLEELRAEGARCKPEELQLLEDRLTVIILRLLGHRWPKQIEVGEPVPAWADADGIISLVSGTGERTLADQIRGRLAAEDGAISAQETERLLVELTGQQLEQWLRTSFFTRHISQFKHRPIAWHLASTPVRGSRTPDKGKKKKGVAGTQRTPVFECFVYYHACGGDVLPRIRTQYVEPLLQMERMKINNNQGVDADDTVALIARERINELEAFVEKLREIEDHGFASPDLEKVVAAETLDRWCTDGYQALPGVNEFLQHERAWQVDINDGVRVNIAPLQLAGVLTKDVLNKKDATKALSDRVRWRADERHWVRDGKLPRCGWMDEMVPASSAWEDLASQRDAEQAKLAQKRLFAQDVEQEEVNL